MKKKLVSISTKTGDQGITGLANGERVSKDHPVFSVIGELDELNSWLGVIAARMSDSRKLEREYLYEIQDTLFYVGAELARSPKATLTLEKLTKLEKTADALQLSLADGWHTKFLLPGGTQLGGFIDVSRTVCRRAERLLVAYSKQEHVSPLLLQYVNRLSDYLYILRCAVNHWQLYHEQEFSVK